LVEWALDRGLQVVVATNPLFPRVAVEQRLAWAGVPVQEYDYTLVTTYENMHATKSDVAYYREVLGRIDRDADECLMVGDSWKMDIDPAMSVGIYAYWVTEAVRPPRSDAALTGLGTLRQLWRRVSAQDSLLPASLGNGN
jgi:FMN phosphatase YigB (HAD superfamily)